MLAKYRTLDYASSFGNVKNADGSPFFASVEEARKAIPTGVRQRLPFEPDHQFVELWESSEPNQ